MLEQLREHLPQHLKAAELRFGPREMGWQDAKIETADNGPQLVPNHDDKSLTIYLHSNLHSLDKANYELAHEAVHLLAPCRGTSANMFEEGCAVWFSLRAVRYNDLNYASRCEQVIINDIRLKNYKNALGLIEKLFWIDGDAARKLRLHRPRFEDFTPEYIVQVLPSVPIGLAKQLCVTEQMREWLL